MKKKAKELESQFLRSEIPFASNDIPANIKSKTAASYRELEARRNRLGLLEKIYVDMEMQKELQKNGKKRKLREDETVCLTSKPVYKWQAERNR